MRPGYGAVAMHTSRLRDCVQVGEATNCHRAPGAKSKTFTHQQADTIGTKEACGNLSIKVNVPTLDMHAETVTQQAQCAVRIHPPAWQDTNQHNMGAGGLPYLPGRAGASPTAQLSSASTTIQKRDTSTMHVGRWLPLLPVLP